MDRITLIKQRLQVAFSANTTWKCRMIVRSIKAIRAVKMEQGIILFLLQRIALKVCHVLQCIEKFIKY